MSIIQQRRIIAVSSMVVFALGIISALQKGQSLDEQARFFIGVGMAFTIVSVMSDMGSELGAGFAMLILLAAFVKEGDTVLGFLIKRGNTRVVQTHKHDTPTVVKGKGSKARVVSGPPPGPLGPTGPGFLGG